MDSAGKLTESGGHAARRFLAIGAVAAAALAGAGDGRQPSSSELLDHGVGVCQVAKLGGNPVPGRHELDNVDFVCFDGSNGNSWAVQQISNRG